MITLESIVESIKLQLKPHLTDDVKLYDEFIIRMINDTRAAMVRSQYISGDPLISYYQEFLLAATTVLSGQTHLYYQMVMTVGLLNGCGRKNIQNISPDANHVGLDMHYCSYEEFMSYAGHIYGVNSFVVTNVGTKILFKDTTSPKVSPKNMYIRAIVETPELVPGYSYTTSEYPIGANNLRQLEIVTFQHLASKLGMPVDVINNGYDETKNANIPQPRTKEQPKDQE
jgi:hypothetical protein